MKYDCFVTYQNNPTVPLVQSIMDWSKSEAQTRSPSNIFLAQTGGYIFAVIVSQTFAQDAVDYVQKFEPSYGERQKRRISHPVLIALETKSVYHRTGMMFGAVGLARPINKFVKDAFTP